MRIKDVATRPFMDQRAGTAGLRKRAGPQGDFGIKFNVAGGGQASEGLTDRIYEHSRTLQRYRIAEDLAVDLDRTGAQSLGEFGIEVIDPVDDYARLMQSLFDFDR